MIDIIETKPVQVPLCRPQILRGLILDLKEPSCLFNLKLAA